MNTINFMWENIEYYGLVLCEFIAVPLALLGTILLIRKDRTPPSVLFTTCALLALTLGVYDDLLYIWITDWTLFMSEGEKSWSTYRRTESILAFVQALAALVSVSAFVVYAARSRPNNKADEESDKPSKTTLSKFISFPFIFSAVAVLITFSAMVYYHVAHNRKLERTHAHAIYLMSGKTERLNINSFSAHYENHYGMLPSSKLIQEIQTILKENPDAKLFHYDTPSEDWQRLSGRMGYAIILGSEIIWEHVEILS